MSDYTNLIQATATKVSSQLETVLLGKTDAINRAVVCLLCQGHLLIEDIPGVGKTILARSLAKLSGCAFKRLQFTPDLLPSDVVGATIYNQQTNQFEIRKGPIFGQVILADEINRATPKTQSALLEAMDERNVTIEGVTYPLPRPFMVIATQNPIEYEGTFPLPEAQLDRFFMKISLGYPAKRDEIEMLTSQRSGHPIDQLSAVIDPDNLLAAQSAVNSIFVSDVIKKYIVDLVQRTRSHEAIFIGASPRGSLALMRAAQARAGILGRDYVLPDDVQELLQSVLVHRIILNVSARLNDVSVESLLEEVRAMVPAPGGNFSL